MSFHTVFTARGSDTISDLLRPGLAKIDLLLSKHEVIDHQRTIRRGEQPDLTRHCKLSCDVSFNISNGKNRLNEPHKGPNPERFHSFSYPIAGFR